MQQRQGTGVALSIAGSDSGGGAGVQADLNTFAALGVHGTCALTCVTAQNPRGVSGVQALTPDMVRRQIKAVLAELSPRAIKTGMLFSRGIIRAVAHALARRTPRPVLIVDPVMIATSGARLLQSQALRALQEELLPLAALVTPNVPEAEALTGLVLREPEALRAAARVLYQRHGCAVLMKGGHLRGINVALDIFYDGRNEFVLSAPLVRGVSTHGTGCTYAAAVTAWCARGCALPEAVRRAKEFITAAITHSRIAGGHPVLNWTRAGQETGRRPGHRSLRT